MSVDKSNDIVLQNIVLAVNMCAYAAIARTNRADLVVSYDVGGGKIFS